MLIPHDQANDTLVVLLSKPSARFHFVYYSLLVMIAAMTAWAYWSVIGITISAYGSIRPSDGIQSYTSMFTTGVDSVYVVENDYKKKGDTLLAFNTLEIDIQLRQLHVQEGQYLCEQLDLIKLSHLPAQQSLFTLRHFEAQYNAIQGDLAMSDNEISANTIKFHRSLDLKEKNMISIVEYEESKRELSLSLMKRDGFLKDKMAYYQTALFDNDAALRDVRTKERMLQEERKRRFIVANSDGNVFQVNLKKGGVQAMAGQELFSLSPSTNLLTEFWVPAKDIGFLAAGFPVRYEIDAYPSQEWGLAAGDILSVSTDVIIDRKTGTPLFKVLGTLKQETLTSHRSGQTAKLIKGLSIRAIVVVAEKRMLDMVFDKTISYFVFTR